MHRPIVCLYSYSGSGVPNIDFPDGAVMTTHDVIAICDKLHNVFGEGYGFIPDSITEGGFEMTQWPDKRAGAYKSMRFGWDRQFVAGEWPAFSDDIRDAWRNADPVIIWSSVGKPKGKAMRGGCIFKALRGAPSWTKEEQRKVLMALSSVGVQVGGVKAKALLNMRF
jgi:hypothetical protein